MGILTVILVICGAIAAVLAVAYASLAYALIAAILLVVAGFTSGRLRV